VIAPEGVSWILCGLPQVAIAFLDKSGIRPSTGMGAARAAAIGNSQYEDAVGEEDRHRSHSVHPAELSDLVGLRDVMMRRNDGSRTIGTAYS